MTTLTTDDRVIRYLEAVGAALWRVGPAARDEIIAELANHISECLGAGRSLDEILRGLGEPRLLAATYARELQPATAFGRIEAFAHAALAELTRLARSDERVRWIRITLTVAIPALAAVGLLTALAVGFGWITLMVVTHRASAGPFFAVIITVMPLAGLAAVMLAASILRRAFTLWQQAIGGRTIAFTFTFVVLPGAPTSPSR